MDCHFFLTTWYLWVCLASLAFCVVMFIVKFIHLCRLGAPNDLSKPAGKVSDGVVYSCTTAMLPQNKESAYLHIPTYAAGMIFHIGTFLSLLTFIWLIVAYFMGLWPSLTPSGTLSLIHHIIAGCLCVSAICGIAILIKRIAKSQLRKLSSFDDYFSNIITTAMQIVTIIYLLLPTTSILYYIVISILFIWMPLGKIKHVMFFFFARFHLGFFYGRRGAWPPAKIK